MWHYNYHEYHTYVCALLADSGTVAGSDATGTSPRSKSSSPRGEAAAKAGAEAGGAGIAAPMIISLEPEALVDVADSCVTVARACGVLQRGLDLRDWFLGGLRAISDAVGPGAPGAVHVPHAMCEYVRVSMRLTGVELGLLIVRCWYVFSRTTSREAGSAVLVWVAMPPAPRSAVMSGQASCVRMYGECQARWQRWCCI